MAFIYILCIVLPLLMQVSTEPIEASTGDKEVTTDAPEFCFCGQYMDRRLRMCKACPVDYFMPDPIHTQVRCYPCHHANIDSAEMDLVKCSATHDTIIGCEQGHFLSIASSFDTDLVKCRPCTNCSQTTPPSYQIEACAKSTDVLCCSDPDAVPVRIDGRPDSVCPGSEMKRNDRTVVRGNLLSSSSRIAGGFRYEVSSGEDGQATQRMKMTMSEENSSDNVDLSIPTQIIITSLAISLVGSLIIICVLIYCRRKKTHHPRIYTVDCDTNLQVDTLKLLPTNIQIQAIDTKKLETLISKIA